MDSVLLDLNYSLRRLLKTPGFSVLAILTLALAIGANTTVFSILNALILRPLPVKHPDGIGFPLRIEDPKPELPQLPRLP